MDDEGVARLIAGIIGRAVQARRLAVTHSLIDENCRMLSGANLKRGDAAEITCGLRAFFVLGGLEGLSDVAGFNLPIEKIKEKSCERYDK